MCQKTILIESISGERYEEDSKHGIPAAWDARRELGQRGYLLVT